MYYSVAIAWSTMFSFGLWNLWLHRNDIIFKHKRDHLNLKKLTLLKALEYWAIMGISKTPLPQSVKEVGWEKPPIGWYKLNTDGAARGNPGPAGCSAVVRDNEGKWVVACSRGFGRASNFWPNSMLYKMAYI